MHGQIFATNNFCSSIAKPEPPDQYLKELKELLRPGLLSLLLSRPCGCVTLVTTIRDECGFRETPPNEHLQAAQEITSTETDKWIFKGVPKVISRL